MKKQSAFDKTRDQVAADREAYAKGYTPELMCTANGCPNRWSSSVGHLCTTHYAASDDKDRWPEITQQQQWDETDRARMSGDERPAPPLPLTRREKADVLLRLRDVSDRSKANPRGWLAVLEEKAARGERLTAGQLHCLQQARKPMPLEEEES